MCSNHFPTNAKVFSFSLAQKSFSGFLQMHKKSGQRKPAKHKKTSRGKISKRGSTIVSKMYNLEAKERHSSVRNRVTAH